MKIIRYSYPAGKPLVSNACYALGFFDGVHIGHRHLIAECVKHARERGLAPAIFTFPSESRELKRKEARLYSTEDKLEIIASLGIEYAVVADFSTVVSLTPERFVKSVLYDELGCRLALSGEGFRFGARAAGNVAALKSLLSGLGADAYTVDDVFFDGLPASSTRIREALSRGDVTRASDMLMSPYFIKGHVERGLGLGHAFGFPTVNIALSEDSPLGRGVYKTELEIDGKCYTGLTNIGVCPTFGERAKHSETLILDFAGDLYERELTVRFIEYLRDERRFDSGLDLKKQIDEDIRRIKYGRSMD